MKAIIMTIGDELLIGQTIDTNSSWIGKELTSMGITVHRKITVPDDKSQIMEALDESLRQAELVLVTGGLGPTKDDITKEAFCQYFGTRLVFNQQAMVNTERFVLQRKGVMNDNNKSQAYLPESCLMIPNNNGTASGMWFENNGRVVVSMPGVPHEMEQMMTETILDRIRMSFTLPAIVIRHVITTGIAESILAEKIAAWEDSLPSSCKLAYLPSPGLVKLRLNLWGNDRRQLDKQADELIATLVPYIDDYIFAFEDEDLAALLGKKLSSKNQTLCTAESCTGGYIAHSITRNPGASAYFVGSIVAYSNEVKISQLAVPCTLIETHGAVSEEVVRIMAENARTFMAADYSIASSGIAGPGGGTPTKPAGTVWVAVSGPRGTTSRCFSLGNDRTRVIQKTTVAALDMLRIEIERNA